MTEIKASEGRESSARSALKAAKKTTRMLKQRLAARRRACLNDLVSRGEAAKAAIKRDAEEAKERSRLAADRKDWEDRHQQIMAHNDALAAEHTRRAKAAAKMFFGNNK